MFPGRMPLVALMLAATPAGASDAALCHRAAAQAAAETGVPLAILTAIMGAESGHAPARGAAPEPWPWTLHAAGRGHWLADAAQGRATLATLMAQGERNIDIGCFQINLHWHGGAFPSPEAMFDPLANARYAARFLHDLHAETGDWRQAAGAYHSRTPALAETYVRRVEQVHLRLGGGGGGTGVAGAGPDRDGAAGGTPAGPLPPAAAVLVDLGRRLPPLLGAP